MANSKDLALIHTSTSDLAQHFLPSAERTALLYHLSYLCLGRFPKLERLIREQALETQLLFGSCEAVLIKCKGTGFNLVNSLFPTLIMAVKMNKPSLAVKHLEKAEAWISDIVEAVKDIVKRYEQQNHKVNECINDVNKEKTEAKGKITQHSMEVKNLEEAVVELEEELRETAATIQETERKYQAKSNELQNSYVTYVPYCYGRWWPYYYYYDDYYNTYNYNSAKTQALNAELSHLTSEKSSLINKEWNTRNKLIDLNLKLASSKEQLDKIPSPDQLKHVQKCLSQIQQIFISIQKQWEEGKSLVDTLKDKTFAGEHLIWVQEMNKQFFRLINSAKMSWNQFNEVIQEALSSLKMQSNTAYMFLETDPSSLHGDEWNNQFHIILGRLQQITSQAPALKFK